MSVTGGLPRLGDVGFDETFAVVGQALFTAVGMDDAADVAARVVGGMVVVVAGAVAGWVGDAPWPSPTG